MHMNNRIIGIARLSNDFAPLGGYSCQMAKMGKQIKELFKRFDVNKTKAAVEMGVSRGILYAWFNDISEPNEENFEALKTYFLKHYNEDVTWLKAGEAPSQEAIDHDKIIFDLMQTVENELARQRLDLPPAERIELYRSLYSLVRDSRHIDHAAIRSLVSMFVARGVR